MLYAFKIEHKYYLALGKNSIAVWIHVSFLSTNFAIFCLSAKFTEYYPRGDLGLYLENNPQMGYNTARLCAAEILLAIEFLHRKKVIYRDLKPENVLIDKFGHLVLTDFGLAEQSSGGAVYGCSGTAHYMAPGSSNEIQFSCSKSF